MPSDQSLLDYIKKCHGLGRTDAQIRADLAKVGWDVQDIESAFSDLNQQPSPQAALSGQKEPPFQKPPSSKPQFSPLDLLPKSAGTADAGAQTPPQVQAFPAQAPQGLQDTSKPLPAQISFASPAQLPQPEQNTPPVAAQEAQAPFSSGQQAQPAFQSTAAKKAAKKAICAPTSTPKYILPWQKAIRFQGANI